MPHIGVGELLLIFGIVLVVFGVGRVGKLGGELGEAIGNFRKGVRSADDPQNDQPKREGEKA